MRELTKKTVITVVQTWAWTIGCHCASTPTLAKKKTAKALQEVHEIGHTARRQAKRNPESTIENCTPIQCRISNKKQGGSNGEADTFFTQEVRKPLY